MLPLTLVLDISQQQLSTNLTKTAVIVIGALLLKLLSKLFVLALTKRLEDDDPNVDTPLEQRTKTLAGISNSVLSVAIYGIALVMVIAEWGVNITPILTGAGVIGLAVGFGAQTLVKDVVTGFFVLLENQFNVGDTVEIAGYKGKVLDMRLRTTVLRGEANEVYTIPNSQITSVKIFRAH